MSGMALSSAKVQRMNTTEAAAAAVAEVKVEQVQCECCGLVEECTLSYIAHVRGIYCGRWICGLCGEAVKEQLGRAARFERVEKGLEDALQAHMSFCREFNKSEKPIMTSPVNHLAAAMRRLLRRSLDGGDPTTRSRSAPNSPIQSAIPSSTNSVCTVPRKTCSTSL